MYPLLDVIPHSEVFSHLKYLIRAITASALFVRSRFLCQEMKENYGGFLSLFLPPPSDQ